MNYRAIIERQRAYQESAEGKLAKALAAAAHTHHQAMRLIVQGAGWHLAEQHWQYCQSASCTMAFRAMVDAKVPGYTRKISTRQRRIEQQRTRIERGMTK